MYHAIQTPSVHLYRFEFMFRKSFDCSNILHSLYLQFLLSGFSQPFLFLSRLFSPGNDALCTDPTEN